MAAGRIVFNVSTPKSKALTLHHPFGQRGPFHVLNHRRKRSRWWRSQVSLRAAAQLHIIIINSSDGIFDNILARGSDGWVGVFCVCMGKFFSSMMCYRW